MRFIGWSILLITAMVMEPHLSVAAPETTQYWTVDASESDLVGTPSAAKASIDTLWIADWTLDNGPLCDDSGWISYDNRILNDGSNYWIVDNRFTGAGQISG